MLYINCCFNLIFRFLDGELNVCANCVDRHVEKGDGDRTALIWERNDPKAEHEYISFKQLHEKVQKMANVLKKYGVKKGDLVTIYLPMIPEIIFTMLACARVGAVHSVVFAGFSSQSLADRIVDAQSRVVVTSDFGLMSKIYKNLRCNWILFEWDHWGEIMKQETKNDT